MLNVNIILTKKENKLQYDIADILKPIIVDRLIFRLINKKQIKKEMFEKKNNGTYLKRDGCEMFIKEFESLLEQTIEVSNKKISYRSLISLEVHKLKQHITSLKKYSPFIMSW